MSQTWHKLSSETLFSGVTFEEHGFHIRAKVFGKMVKLSEDVIEDYHSDLFHDAKWLTENLTGAGSFDWIVRSGGTFIGEVCMHIKDADWPGTLRFRLELMVEIDKKWVLNTYQALEHETLPIEQCDVATTTAGCIYHLAPVANVSDTSVDDIIKLLFEPSPAPKMGGWHESNNPTLRNDLTTEPNAPFRKENKMESIIRDLREKYEEASNTKDQLEEYQSNINDAVDELDTYMSDLDSLIDSLDSLPEVSVYCDLDTVSFDS